MLSSDVSFYLSLDRTLVKILSLKKGHLIIIVLSLVMVIYGFLIFNMLKRKELIAIGKGKMARPSEVRELLLINS